MPANMLHVRNYIGGELVQAACGGTIDNVEPATGAVYGAMPDSDARDVDQAVSAAMRAFAEWSSTPAEQRCQVLCRLADLVDANLEDLARAESIDNGKPISLARSMDIPRAAANLRFFAHAVLHWKSEAHITEQGATAAQGGRSLNYTLRPAIGAVGCIWPWNLPLYLFTWKIAPALATGNTVVGKPSELTPVTAFRLSQLAIEAGLPPGVLNIVHGLGAKAGAAITTHPGVKAVSFTGGSATGAAIARVAGPLFKKLSLEMGGKNPNIVFADADFDAALSGSVAASFANQGQVCLCGSRLLVEQSICDRFVDSLVQCAKARQIGDPLEPSTQHGAQVSKQHLDKITSYYELAQQEGGTIRCGGPVDAASLPQRCRDGFFFAPTVITGLGPDCRTNQEEIFGPIVTVQSFRDEAHAIELANASAYGLSSSVWTSDVTRAHRVAERIEAGTVWVNCWLRRDLRVPFGGMKSSGVGREGGEEAMRFFTETKNVCVNLE